MADQVATVEIQAKSSGLAAALREARAKFASFADGVTGLMIKAAGKANNAFGKKGVGGALGKTLATAGGNLISSGVSAGAGAMESAAESAFTYNEHLTRLQILANSTPEAMQAFDASVKRSSDATGKGRVEILDAASAYVALTGDMNTAAGSIDTWTRVAQATGSSVSDISQAAAALSVNLHVTAQEMGDVFGAIASQGKTGAIEIKDLAAQLANVAPAWAQFKGGTGAQAAKDIGAALQVGKRGFGGDASETVTGMRDMLVAVAKHAPEFEAAGVKIFDVGKNGKKSFRSVLDIVDGISKSTLMKDPTILEKAFGRDTGKRFFDQLVLGRKDLEDMRTTVDGMGMINKDLGTYLASPAGRAVIAYNKLKNVFADLFTPERIEKFSAILERMLPAVGKVAEFISNSVAAIDYFVNGPGTELGGNKVASDLVEKAQSGQGDDQKKSEQDAIDEAKRWLKTSDADLEKDPYGPASQYGGGSAAAVKAGARKFLKSEGVDMSIWGGAEDKDTTQGDLNNQAAARASARQVTPKDITAAIIAGMKDLHITITADGAAIAQVVKQAPTARHNVKK